MNLEQAIQENTAAILTLVEKMSGQSALPLEEPEPLKVVKTFTKDDVVKALTDLRSEKGADVAKGILQSIEYTKLSDVPADKYPLIMEKVEKAA